MPQQAATCQPKPQDHQCIDHEEATEQKLVPFGEPIWQVDIEGRGPVGGKPGGERRERAFAPVEGQDGAFEQHTSGHGRGNVEAFEPASHGERKNARRKEGPHRRMHGLDGDETGRRRLMRAAHSMVHGVVFTGLLRF